MRRTKPFAIGWDQFSTRITSLALWLGRIHFRASFAIFNQSSAASAKRNVRKRLAVCQIALWLAWVAAQTQREFSIPSLKMNQSNWWALKLADDRANLVSTLHRSAWSR